MFDYQKIIKKVILSSVDNPVQTVLYASGIAHDAVLFIPRFEHGEHATLDTDSNDTPDDEFERKKKNSSKGYSGSVQ